MADRDDLTLLDLGASIEGEPPGLAGYRGVTPVVPVSAADAPTVVVGEPVADESGSVAGESADAPDSVADELTVVAGESVVDDVAVTGLLATAVMPPPRPRIPSQRERVVARATMAVILLLAGAAAIVGWQLGSDDPGPVAGITVTPSPSVSVVAPTTVTLPPAPAPPRQAPRPPVAPPVPVPVPEPAPAPPVVTGPCGLLVCPPPPPSAATVTAPPT